MSLLIVLGSLILVTWIFSMYVSWKATQGVPLALVQSAPFLARWDKGMRMTRRRWYGATRMTREAFTWSNKKASAVFVKFFPKSAPVFVKRDMLTGLTQGPSSYFLKTISKAPHKAGNRRLPRTKKVL